MLQSDDDDEDMFETNDDKDEEAPATHAPHPKQMRAVLKWLKHKDADESVVQDMEKTYNVETQENKSKEKQLTLGSCCSLRKTG